MWTPTNTSVVVFLDKYKWSYHPNWFFSVLLKLKGKSQWALYFGISLEPCSAATSWPLMRVLTWASWSFSLSSFNKKLSWPVTRQQSKNIWGMKILEQVWCAWSTVAQCVWHNKQKYSVSWERRYKTDPLVHWASVFLTLTLIHLLTMQDIITLCFLSPVNVTNTETVKY